MEPEFPWPRSAKNDLYPVHKKWLEPIWKSFEKKNRTPYEKMWFSLLRKEDYLLRKSSAEYGYYIKPIAIEICEIYLKIIDKTQWPLLIGISSVMDEILGKAFKEEK